MPKGQDANTLDNFLRDTFSNLRRRAADAAMDQHDDFSRGRAMAYAEVLGHLQNQADSFLIPREALGLDGFDPIQDLAALAPRTGRASDQDR